MSSLWLPILDFLDGIISCISMWDTEGTSSFGGISPFSLWLLVHDSRNLRMSKENSTVAGKMNMEAFVYAGLEGRTLSTHHEAT